MASTCRMTLSAVGFLVIALCHVVVSEPEAYDYSGIDRRSAEPVSAEIVSGEEYGYSDGAEFSPLGRRSAESESEEDIDDLIDRGRRSYGGQEVQHAAKVTKVSVHQVPPAYKQQPAEPLHIEPRICSGAGPRQDVLFSHPERCDKYIQCVHGLPMVRDCGPGTFWIPNKNYCGAWKDSFCANVMRLVAPTTTCRCNDFVLPLVSGPISPPTSLLIPAPRPVPPPVVQPVPLPGIILAPRPVSPPVVQPVPVPVVPAPRPVSPPVVKPVPVPVAPAPRPVWPPVIQPVPVPGVIPAPRPVSPPVVKPVPVPVAPAPRPVSPPVVKPVPVPVAPAPRPVSPPVVQPVLVPGVIQAPRPVSPPIVQPVPLPVVPAPRPVSPPVVQPVPVPVRGVIPAPRPVSPPVLQPVVPPSRPVSPPIAPLPPAWPLPPSPPVLRPVSPPVQPVQPVQPVLQPRPVPGLTVQVPHISPAICQEAGTRLDVIFAHPDRCDQYIQCVHGLPRVRSCGPDTYFDPKAKNCGFWKTSYCANNMQIPFPTQTCTCNDYKLHHHGGKGHHSKYRREPEIYFY